MDNNLKQHYRELAEKIESGEYFHEARDWYIKKYEYHFIERAYLLLMILCFVILFSFLFTYYKSILPIKKSLPIKATITSAADFSTKITYLGNSEKKFDVNEVLIKYFAGRFVEAIESYDYRDNFKKLRINKNMIESLASDDINTYYLDKISIRNSDSIILKYKKKISRKIIVDTATAEIAPYNATTMITPLFSDDKNKSKDIRNYQLTVNFDAIERAVTGTQNKSRWQAKIILSFQTILYNYEEKDFSPFNFKVLSYESRKID